MSKIVYWISVGCLTYYVVKSVVLVRLGASIADALAIGLWVFLAWMLFRRPKTWGLGIGVFMIITIAIQVALWRLNVANAERTGLEVDASWAKFGLSVVPLFVGGVGSISLRWLFPEEPIQAPGPMPLKRHGSP